ncbi:YfhO family protein [Pollutibacter soli]|uniref:YfhO family protein n=1 Tax=Pollutibacter soli TaxID=3034157 RepID=UPI003013219C
MKNVRFKNVLPHLVAVLSFVIIAVIFCRPALDGKVLQQSDVMHWKGMSKDIQDYRDTHNGVAPLWTKSMFSGMPGFQIATNNNNYISYWANEAFSLFIPKPYRFFILACLGFYFLGIVLRVNPWIAALGAIGYAYASYSPILVVTGHDTKMLSMAYLPALLGGLFMVYDRKYWLGSAFTALFSSILIYHNHYQIVYYFLLLAAFMVVGNFIYYLKRKELSHFFIASAFAITAGVVGILTNAVMLFTTYDYSKATIRGGQASINTIDSVQTSVKKGGLDTGYAFLYGSMGKAESFTLLVPRAYGGSPQPLGEESKLVEKMQEKGLPGQLMNQLYSTFRSYWGDQPGHSGSVYLGAIFCFLFVFGMIFLKTHHKWWILGITILALFMSWGKNLAGFNTFLFEHLPMNNKFRAPSIILVIPQLTFPLIGVMVLQRFIFGTYDKAEAWKQLRLAGIVMAGIFLLAGFLYISADYKSSFERGIQQQLSQISPNDPGLGKDIMEAVVSDRKSLFGKDLFRSLFFVGAAFALLFFYLRGKLKALPVMVVMALLVCIDTIGVASRFLNSDIFIEPEDYDGMFQPTAADLQIKKDPDPYYRVLNLSNGGDFANDAITSYHHNSIGGYHAAKLSIYQDLLENQLSRQPLNVNVLNMLNTKYVISPDEKGQPVAQQNPGALGNAWVVKDIRYVPSPREEMLALNDFRPDSTAIVQEMYKKDIPFQPQSDSTATVKLEKNENDVISYNFQSAANQFVVFSEVFYDRGWKAFIDGKETPIVKTDYVLRGLAVPAGKHHIVFRFEPSSYTLGSRVTTITQFILLILFAAGIFLEYRKNKPEYSAKA